LHMADKETKETKETKEPKETKETTAAVDKEDPKSEIFWIMLFN